MNAFSLVSDASRIAGRLLELERDSRRMLTGSARRDALDWYPIQADSLWSIARELDMQPGTVIACAATLSPATAWGALLADLPEFILAARSGDPVPPFATYGRQRQLAARIVRAGSGPEACSGPKVRPFALALYGDASQVVVDRHTARLALAEDVDRVGVNAGERKRIQLAHRIAGEVLGIAPRDLQALLWVARVGMNGATQPARRAAA